VKTIKRLALLMVGALTACVTQDDLRQRQKADIARREQHLAEVKHCERPDSFCSTAALPEMSLGALKAKGNQIKFRCEFEFIDYTEESARKACGESVLAAVNKLTERFPEQLLPVDPSALQIHLSDYGCDTLYNGYCACTFNGWASAPLAWKSVAEPQMRQSDLTAEPVTK
jgi:hypothetical protein